MRDTSTGDVVGTSRDKTTSNSAKIKPVALVVIELRLSEGISESQSVSQSISGKFDFKILFALIKVFPMHFPWKSMQLFLSCNAAKHHTSIITKYLVLLS